MLTTLGCLLVGLVAQEESQRKSATAEITNGRFTVTVDDYGALVGVPLQGLHLGEGRRALLRPGFAEWFGMLYDGPSGHVEIVGLGSAADWAGRTVVERVSFAASRDRAVAITRTPELFLRTTYCFEGVGDYLVVFTDVKNLCDAPLRNILFSREWRTTEDVAWSYPEDLVPPGPVPEGLCRVVRMPDDLQPHASQCITHYYSLNQDIGSRADDVPLVLWRNADWPNGLPIGATNGVSWGDYNADNWPDFFACQGAELWRNVDGTTWRRKDLSSLLPLGVTRYGCAFGDYNNDHRPDIGCEPRSHSGDPFMKLLKSLGDGNFFEVAGDPNIVDLQPSGDAETLNWIDVDFDGNLDAFLPVYPPWAANGEGNFFLHNLGATGPGGEYRFHEASAEVGLDNPPPDSARPEGADFCDVDFDGDMDHYSCGTLFQNVSTPGQPKFRFMTEAASGIGLHIFYDEGAAFFDYDLDGDWDLPVAYCVGGHGVRIWESRGDGTYFLAAKSIIDSPNTGLCLGFSKCDWDMDGDIDFTTKEVFRRNMLMETGDRHFIVATHSIPGSHLTSATPAWADWDKDGDPDCLLGNWLSVGHFYENYLYDSSTAPEIKRDVRVKVLRDSDTVPAGLETEYGAVVEVVVRGEDSRKRKQFVASAGGYLNQNEYTLHFALPADPDPADPLEDVHFDIVVDFPSDPAVGIRRVDRTTNPELGDVNLADLSDREIFVFRSGKVVIDGCTFLPVGSASPVLTTTTGGLALATDTVPLPDPTPSPSSDWYVGVDFETDATQGPQLVKEVIVDGVLSLDAVNCGSGDFKVALWDVTDPANPEIVDGGALWSPRRVRNRRIYIPADARVEAGHHYRLVARVESLRASPISAPVVNGAVTVLGGLSFQDTSPCDGVAVVAASSDPSNVYAAIRFASHPGPLWADLGYALAGTNGDAKLSASGELKGGSTVTLQLSNALAFAHTFLLGGTSALCQPMRGGTLLPEPNLVLGVNCDANGAWTLAGPWPANVDPGTSAYFQVWFPDAGAAQGLAASNAMSGTTDF